MNILLVSIAFPPKRDPEALQVARYLSALTRMEGVQVDVVTSANPTLSMPTDEGLLRYARGYRQLVEVGFFESRYTNFALQKLWPGLLLRPDSRSGFWRRWKMAARALRSPPDVIYSRSFPLSSTLMAYHLAGHYDVPWVLHLSDPWTLSPLHSIAKAQAWNEDAEAKCFARAAAITLTSQKTADLYRARYPQHAAKFRVLPNVYEGEALVPNPWSAGRRLRLVHTGSLIGSRSPAPVIAALERLAATRPEVRRDIEVVFAGLCDRENAALLARHADDVDYLGNVPLQQALAQQRGADVLLLLDSAFDDPALAMFFPSKLLDYVTAQRRVIGITDRDSTSWQVIGQLGLGDRVAHRDVDGLCRVLVDTWAAWKQGDRSHFERSGGAEHLESGFNARRLMEIFRAVLVRHQPAVPAASLRPLSALSERDADA